MNEAMKKKQFVQLQFALLLLALTALPSFGLGSLIGSVIGLGNLSLPVLFGRIAGLVLGCMALVSLVKSMGNNLPVPYLCVACTGMFIVLLTIIPSMPSWLDYIAVILLFVAVFMGKGQLNIQWQSEGTQGAYLIFLATLMQIYYSLDPKIATSIAALVGLLFLIIGLGKFGQGMDAAGTTGVGRLKVAAWIGIIGMGIMILLGWIPAIGIIVAILVGIANIVAYIFELLGYSSLQQAQPLKALGQSGASNLRISMILMLVAVVLSIIPVIGGILSGILTLVVFWLVYSGWTKIIAGMEQ